jgi:hypothetical protein
MPKKKITFDTVREMGLALPDVEEGTIYRSPALKVHGKMFTCLAIHRSADPDTLAIRIDFDQRAELMAADPNTYYLTDHYVNYPVMLVRLTRVHPDALRDLLLMAWRFVSTSGKRRGGQRKRKHRAAGNRSPQDFVRAGYRTDQRSPKR